MNNEAKEKIQKTIAQQTQVDGALREIFEKHFELKEEKNKDNPGYMAWGGQAVEVALALANVIISIKKPESGRSFRAICDLTYALNANEFWVKNASVLVPIITIFLNAHKDGMDLHLEREGMGEYAIHDRLLSSTQIVPLEIFSMILYLAGGPMLMAVSSLPLKIDLAPYISNS